jgi:hypothetical protein
VNTDTGSDIKDLHGCMQIISCYTPGCGCTADLCCCICTGPAARRCETPLPPPACPAGGGGAARAPHARPPARRPAAQEPFAGEERRLALLAALLLPLRAAEAPGKKKGARAPATAHVVREALKWRARDADAVAEAHAAAPELLRLHARLRARRPPGSSASRSKRRACSRLCGAVLTPGMMSGGAAPACAPAA